MPTAGKSFLMQAHAPETRKSASSQSHRKMQLALTRRAGPLSIPCCPARVTEHAHTSVLQVIPTEYRLILFQYYLFQYLEPNIDSSFISVLHYYTTINTVVYRGSTRQY